MALLRKAPVVDDPPKRRAVVASAARFTFGGAQAWRGTLPAGDRRWQVEAWRHYDQCGELRYATGWKGNACAQAIMYAAEIDPDTGRPTGPTENPTIRDIAGAVLGGPVKRPQHIRTMVINLEMTGEVYVVVVPKPPKRGVAQPDEWLVVSGTEPYQSGGDVEYTHPDTGAKTKVGPRDTLIRIWTPHPRLQLAADSAVRAALPTLREIEKSSQNIAARLDSRLVGAGLLVTPSEADFPTEDDSEPEEDYSLTKRLFESFSAALSDPGSAASQVPIIAEVPAELADGFKYLTFETPLSKEVIALREAAVARLAAALDLPREVVEGMGESNHWCVDDQTEALTQRGWVRHDQLTIGDMVMTLNHVTGLGEWQPVQNIYRAHVTGETMLAMETGNHSSLTTLHHRWPVFRSRERAGETYVSREIVHSEDLTYAHSITTGAPCADTPTEAKHSDALVELAAWFWTEGNVSRTGIVSIAQSHTRNPSRVARIRAALTELYGPASDSLRGTSLPAWREDIQSNEASHGGPITVFRLNQHAAPDLLAIAPGKRVSTDFIRQLTRAQLSLFVDVSAQGDGWHYRAGRLDMWQRERDALEAYELALILLGHTVRLYESGGGWCVSPWAQTSIRPVKAAQQSPQSSRAERVEYTGTVWCPVTENSTWFARRNGTVYYTGNSAWQVAEETYRTHLVPILDVISDALTQAYLYPIATAAKIKNVESYMLAFDGSALIGEPDPLQQVLELLDRGLITPQAALTMLHIPEDYAPTGDDRMIALATRLVTAAPTLFERPELRKILGFEDTPALPAQQTEEPAAITASAAPVPPVDIAALAVRYALERAGNRLLQTQRLKQEFAHVPTHELHVKLRPSDRHGDLLEGAWRHVPQLAFTWDLDRYTRRLIAEGLPHDDALLAEWMTSHGR